MTNRRQSVEALLPLPLAAFHVLMALAEGERHGYAIIQEVSARTGGKLELSAGTLYRSIHRMLGQRLIREARKRVSVGDDPRRRYYRLTSFGREVARAESARLEQLVELARSSGLAAENA